MQMARTLFFRMVHRKSSEIANNKPNFSQYNIYYNYEYFFFQSAFWSVFNHRQGSQSNQEQCSVCCSSSCFVLLCTHYGPLQCFTTYFRKLKEIGILRSIFPDYSPEPNCRGGGGGITPSFWKKYHPFPFINTPPKLKFLQKSPPTPVY